MVLYLGERGKFAILGSTNLKDWQRLSNVAFPDGQECPELFSLPVDDDPGNTHWAIWEGGGRHRIGHFDGKTFIPETDILPDILNRSLELSADDGQARIRQLDVYEVESIW